MLIVSNLFIENGRQKIPDLSELGCVWCLFEILITCKYCYVVALLHYQLHA